MSKEEDEERGRVQVVQRELTPMEEQVFCATFSQAFCHFAAAGAPAEKLEISSMEFALLSVQALRSASRRPLVDLSSMNLRIVSDVREGTREPLVIVGGES